MAGAAVLGRLTWLEATVSDLAEETPTTRRVTLDVDGWDGHVPGQHVDVRLTAPDGYTSTRSYSIASAPTPRRLELAVARVPGGEVSGYLAGPMAEGDQVEVRGPLGGWFVWRPEEPGPVQLIAGGVGLAPLMSMVRARAQADSPAPMRLLCSVRDPASRLYARELAQQGRQPDGVDVTWVYTRGSENGALPRRIDPHVVQDAAFAASESPTCYVCGPTGFVETAAALLVDAGHDPGRIRAERFGPTGGRS
ncbi:ferredoxin reductase [Cellulomonas chengniuliangii]|uniref:Ferredoxin reductase n=1 Tax=Cellulomonas chengniuliangii TaxID=2968084 RepID=A0ABY5L4V0_9CELL|nr:ferredoxin reductase [Cellulomonas chengniuliangii]MCC2308323.1 ferredoxin reductase [Cellulomonas chengniuliangii]MCC2317331.1 ferredoxin reductase [Cellulomonas chengniuliangii]UUI76706.1 ferredoxin reductase [Cellulomonas chengniuliangii]